MQFERVFVQHLVVPESLRVIVERDLPDDIFPEEMLRPLYRFAIDYWHTQSGDVAPSPEAMRLHFSNALAEHGIDLDIEPEDTLEWAIDVIQGSYIDRFWAQWVRESVSEMGDPNVDLLDKAPMLEKYVQQLMEIQSRFSRRSEKTDIGVGAKSALDLYDKRVANVGDMSIVGALFGLPQIDAHTGGIRPGEVAILSAPAKVGKSFSLLWGAYQYWKVGGRPVLFSLENSLEMTLDRLACMVLKIDSREWDEGVCSEEDIVRVRNWVDQLQHNERSDQFQILQPEQGKRTAEQLVRLAKTLGDALYLDQLTFVEVSVGMERRPRHEQVGDMMRIFKNGSMSGQRLSTVIAHQINRDGIEHARKTGFLLMEHLAESAEIERTADYVFGLWQSQALRDTGQALFQMLAARRRGNVHWVINWRPYIGKIEVVNTFDLPQAIV